ncbi:MAG: multicopper oxidase domain-containing protein [Hyphomicrobiaceae bacterium]
MHAGKQFLIDRRSLLTSAAAFSGAVLFGEGRAFAQAAPLLTVDTKTIEVNKKAAKIFSVKGRGNRVGLVARAGDRFSGSLLNASAEPLQMHWHGQVNAPASQDRARPDGGTLLTGAADVHDFELTSGTHWMHSHSLSEQQLLAAPMVAVEKDAGDIQNVIVMLHDFSHRTPQEILAGIGGSSQHSGQGAAHGSGGSSAPPMSPGVGGHQMPGHSMGGGMMMGRGMGGSGMMGMTHANDVTYDAYLANERTFDDPEVIEIEAGARVRIRIINGATATAFHISTPGLLSRCISVDGTSCQPVTAVAYPLAQGQRIDLVIDVPKKGGMFPLHAQVEAARFVTGLILATRGAPVRKLGSLAERETALVDLSLEMQLRAASGLPAKRPNQSFMMMLGEEPGYRWTINGRVHGEHQPLKVRHGERVEITFMNPTSMMHPMHLHGHHFQVVGIGGQRFSGAMRDTIIVPAHAPVTVAFDALHKGSWFLHCHHLYHMATGMMTEVQIA